MNRIQELEKIFEEHLGEEIKGDLKVKWDEWKKLKKNQNHLRVLIKV